MEQQDQNQNQGAVAGYPIQQDDIITGAVIKSARGVFPGRVNTGKAGQRVNKNKSRKKGQASQRTAPADVVVSSEDAARSVANPASKKELIDKIKSMPDQMLPSFIKKYADIMVEKFEINTREKAANFFGQIAAESIRGIAEGVYYTTPKALQSAFGGRVKREHYKNFLYSTQNLSYGNYGYPAGKPTPWQINGLNDTYYGRGNGNTFNKVSDATNTTKNVQPSSPVPDSYINPGFYKGSPDGYSYRGHGVIQLTGKVQYQKMNEYFGVNGKYEKNNIDFLKEPDLVAYNWRNPSEPSKFAFLGALMWWKEHREVYINKVSISTTKTITDSVRGSSSGYQERHINVERYYNFLIGRTSPIQPSSATANKVILRVPTSKIRFIGGNSRTKMTGDEFKQTYKLRDFSNLSFFKNLGGTAGKPVGPYKDDSYEDRSNPQGFAVFTISRDNIARIYYGSEMTDSVWKNIKYACAGSPIMLDNGNPVPESYWNTTQTQRMKRLTGRTAVGIMGGGTELVICVLRTSKLGNLSTILSQQGCYTAINFDGGGSTFAYVGGNVVIPSYENRAVSTVMSWS